MTLDATSGTRTLRDYTVVVAVRHMDDGPQFLMVRHQARGWELPGGKVEAKEGPVHCALREFREETGHLLALPRFVLKLEKENGTCFVFTGAMGEEVVDRERDEAIAEYAWFDALPNENLAFPDDPYEEIGAKIGITFR